MTDKEKIEALKHELRGQLEWYREAVEDRDEDYAYDEAHNEFDRSACYTVLQILSED